MTTYRVHCEECADEVITKCPVCGLCDGSCTEDRCVEHLFCPTCDALFTDDEMTEVCTYAWDTHADCSCDKVQVDPKTGLPVTRWECFMPPEGFRLRCGHERSLFADYCVKCFADGKWCARGTCDFFSCSCK